MSGILERRATPPKPALAADTAADEDTPDETEGQGRGRRSSESRRGRAASKAASKKSKPRTIHLPDDLFERVLVQSHRRGLTISDYVASVLDRQVPDHRVVRATDAPDAQAG